MHPFWILLLCVVAVRLAAYMISEFAKHKAATLNVQHRAIKARHEKSPATVLRIAYPSSARANRTTFENHN